MSLWALCIRVCKPRISTSNQQCSFHRSSGALITFPLDAQPVAESSITEARNLAKQSKWDELMDSLSRNRANPSRVWNTYLELGSITGFQDVPFEVQKQVLRKCVPSTAHLRVAAARRLQAGNNPRVPHIYETRLQMLIGHMRANGQKPELDDYNFILEQFAAVGHQHGARQVFQELAHVGVEPSYRTYGLCLQAIAHRLTLPCPYRFRTDMLTEASRMCSEMLDDMWNRRIPLTSVNFDLVLRIFKETMEQPTIEKLLKVGYGIDLAYPDRPLWEMHNWGTLLGSAKALKNQSFKPLPFSTSALNTLIDLLGKTKQISRMVTAFEVYTNPIPASILTPISGQNNFDEDEDDPAFYPFSLSESTPFQPPSAAPNTTSFNMLIRYASKAKHAVFARHYVVQAMKRDREVDARLRSDLSSKPIEDITSPNFAVNRGTFLPPFGLANRTKHFAFLRWTLKQAALALDRKKEDLAFYSNWRQVHIGDTKTQSQDSDSEALPNSNEGSITSDFDSSDSISDNIHDTASPNVSERVPTSPSHPSPTPVVPEISEVLRLDLDAPPPPLDVTRKVLDLNLHISLLTRDVEEIGELVNRMLDAKQRLSQRVKERLGRRIWQGKDIFLMSHNARVRVDKTNWKEIVRYRSPKPEQAWKPSRSSAEPRAKRRAAPHLHPQKRWTRYR